MLNGEMFHVPAINARPSSIGARSTIVIALAAAILLVAVWDALTPTSAMCCQ